VEGVRLVHDDLTVHELLPARSLPVGDREELVRRHALLHRHGRHRRPLTHPNVRVVEAPSLEHRLERLLDGLLCVEADDLVGDLQVGGQLPQYDGVVACLGQENRKVALSARQ